MKKIAILGGAFNPPTIAHQQLADFIISKNYADEVWLMPCFKHNFGKQMVAFDHRWNMCRRIARNNIYATNFEKFRKPNNSYEMLKLLKMVYEWPSKDKPQFFMVIGQDNADNIDKWKNWEKLIEETNFIIFPRKYESERDILARTPWYTFNKKCIFLGEFKANDISSTLVRKLLKNKDKSVKNFLNEEVHKYIKANRLYR